MVDASKGPAQSTRKLSCKMPFGRRSKLSQSPETIENSSLSQVNTIEIPGTQPIEGFGDNTQLDANISSMNNSHVKSISITEESITTNCEGCRNLEVKIKRENALKIRAAREAATSRHNLEQLATQSQTMLKTILSDFAACRKEVDRLLKANAQLAVENMELKHVLTKMKMIMDKVKF